MTRTVKSAVPMIAICMFGGVVATTWLPAILAEQDLMNVGFGALVPITLAFTLMVRLVLKSLPSAQIDSTEPPSPAQLRLVIDNPAQDADASDIRLAA